MDESTSLHAVIDIVKYSRLDFRQQDEAQKHLVEFIKVSLYEARADRVRIGPRGDALTLTFPDGRNVSEVLAVMPRRLSYELDAFNRDKMPHARMRVRLSFAMGPSVPGPLGEVGSAPIAVARLNNASALREAMKAEPNAYLGVCIDDYLYFQHVAQASRPDLKPNEYYRVDVSDPEKDFKADAWIRLVGRQPRLLRQGPAVAAPRFPPWASEKAGTSGWRQRIRLTTAWATLIVGVITAAVTLSVYPANSGAVAGQSGGHGPTTTPAPGATEASVSGRSQSPTSPPPVESPTPARTTRGQPRPSRHGPTTTPTATKPSAPHRSQSPTSPPPVESPTPAITTQALVTFPTGFVSWHNLNTGDCLDSTGVGHVFTDACNGGKSQRWLGQGVSGAIYVLQNEQTGYCLTRTQTGIYSAACETSNPQQQWRVNESHSLTPFLSNGSCLADPASDHLATVECDGSAYSVDSVGSVDRRDQYWHAGG